MGCGVSLDCKPQSATKNNAVLKYPDVLLTRISNSYYQPPCAGGQCYTMALRVCPVFVSVLFLQIPYAE